jgi:hypothetical protein
VTLREMMEQEVEAMNRIGFPREQNLKAAVLEHGQAYELDRDATAEADQGKLKECFTNAGHAALFNDDVTYVEGFATSGWGLAVHHAWVIDNETGKAIELTWRDGGDDCGFCDDGEQELDDTYEAYDEDDEETWVQTCFYCEGTGKCPHGEHSTLDDAQYYGIAVDAETLRKIVLKRQTWGVLNSQEDLDDILAARQAA